MGKCLLRYWWNGYTEKLIFFPPGDTQYDTLHHSNSGHRKKGIRSPWREFEFWFMAVKHAIVPKISIEKAIKDWPQLRERLMENSRKRSLQMGYIMPLI